MPTWVKGVLLAAGIAGAFVAMMLGIRCRDASIKEPFDADKHLASGMKEAGSHGAELESIEVTMVNPEARVYTEYGGSLRVSWVARDNDPDEKAVMPGAPRKGGGARCSDYWLHVHVEHDMDGDYFDDDMNVNHGMSCWRKTAPGPLFCSIKAIWDRAIAAGAPHPALATIKLDTREDKTRQWTFTIVDNVENGPRKTLFAGRYADDCSPRVEK